MRIYAFALYSLDIQYDITWLKRVFCCCRFVVVVLLFYVHGKHLRSCRDGQLT